MSVILFCLLFQSAAASLTLLYRERDGRRHQQQHPAEAEEQSDSLWQPFQSAAGSLTQLYRESLEGLRVGAEGVRRSGYQKCRRDLASWASLHRRRYIRRDELLRLLATGMESDFAPTQPQPQPPQPHHEQLPHNNQDQLFLQAFSAFSPIEAPLGSPLPPADPAAPFSCLGRTLKRPHSVTPPPPASSSDKDVHMDTPTSKKPKTDS